MKKKILILFGVLLGIYIVLTMMDTSEYRAEKSLWRMQKKYTVIAQDPKAVPESQFKRVIKGYRNLIKRYSKSKYVPQMYSSIGMLYAMNKDYENARKVFGEVVTKFSDSPAVVSKALMDIGNVYLIENKMKQAVGIYRRIWIDYSETEAGFMMPLYIAKIYSNTGQEDMVQKYLAEAVAFYKNIAENEENSHMVRIVGYQTLATAYIAQKEWEKALDVLKKILYDYADSKLMTPQRLSGITRTLNLVCIVRLKDFDRAKAIYGGFIDDHSGHYLNPFLEKVLESLDLMKENNLTAVVPQK